jgi:hypothetical protein|tara:strand:+ start:345 stop:1025 length:681 start_codon:yes stop_codon:yes gene_type:complete
MGTLASNRKGFITGATQTNYGDALAATTGTVSDSQTVTTNAIQYFQSSGRGGGTFRFIRTFLHFDTSGISGGSNFQITLTSGTSTGGNDSKITAIKHSAGSSNGSALSSGDFDNIDRNTTYSGSTSFGANTTVTISLNAAAASQIIGENDFNVALLLTHDVNAEEESPLGEDGSITNQIAFGSAINLTYTDPVTGYGHKVNSVASANIAKVNTVATANIGKINTVD